MFVEEAWEALSRQRCPQYADFQHQETLEIAPRCSEDVSKTPKDGSRWEFCWASTASERSERCKRSDQN